MFDSPEVAAADRIIATPGFGAVVPVAPAERVIRDLQIRRILAGLAEVTPEANGAEGDHAGGRA